MLKNNIESLLYSAKMTRYELAKKCDFITANKRVMYTTIDNAMSNKNVTVESAFKIFNALKDAQVCERFEEVFYFDHNTQDVTAAMVGEEMGGK